MIIYFCIYPKPDSKFLDNPPNGKPRSLVGHFCWVHPNSFAIWARLVLDHIVPNIWHFDQLTFNQKLIQSNELMFKDMLKLRISVHKGQLSSANCRCETFTFSSLTWKPLNMLFDSALAIICPSGIRYRGKKEGERGSRSLLFLFLK